MLERFDVTSPDRLIPVAYAVPCIMYMHNRVTEKIGATLFCKGFALHTTQQQKIARKLDKFRQLAMVLRMYINVSVCYRFISFS